MEDQYYISLADSFGSSVFRDCAIEVTSKTPKGKGEGNNALPSITKQEDAKRIPQFIVSPNRIKKQQKVLGATDKDLAIAAANEQEKQHDSNKKSRAWQKLRISVQRKMMDIQLLESRRSAPSSTTRATRSQDDTGNDISSTFPHQFQDVLLVNSKSTCSTSTEISDFGEEARHDVAEQRHDNIADRDNDDSMYYSDEVFQLSLIEEGDERRQSSEEGDDALITSSSNEGVTLSTITKDITSDKASPPTQQKKHKRNGLRAQLEDSQMLLEAANTDKKVLKGQLDASVYKLGKLRKVIQQRSMENSRLNSILDEKNSIIETKNHKIDGIELALKSTQDTNKKLEREVKKLRQQLSAEEKNTRALHSKLDIVSRAGAAASGTMMEYTTGVSSATSIPSPAGGRVSALKERGRVFGTRGSAKQGSEAYAKLSDEGTPMDGEDDIPVASEQSIISTMAKKFSGNATAASEDNSIPRIELEKIRQNLQGKCKNTKSSLEHQWLSNISIAKKQDEDIGARAEVIDGGESKNTNTPTNPKAEEHGAFETFFSPLKARIDLLEASCTNSTDRNGYGED